MKAAIILLIILVLNEASSDNLIFKSGSRQRDDQWLQTLTERTKTFATPQSVLTVEINGNFTGRYITQIEFTTPQTSLINSTLYVDVDGTNFRAAFSAKDSLWFQVDAKVYGFQYSPGPIYP